MENNEWKRVIDAVTSRIVHSYVFLNEKLFLE